MFPQFLFPPFYTRPICLLHTPSHDTDTLNLRCNIRRVSFVMRHTLMQVSQQAQAQQQQQLPSSAHRQWGSRQNLTAALCHSRRRTPRSIRTPAASPVAMVNVDFSPSLLLGIGMIGGGLALYQVRLSKPWISRDYDVVISSVAILTGGILIFQVSLQ